MTMPPFAVMEFRTVLVPQRSAFTVDHSRAGLIAGSCFSEHIAARLTAARFPVTANPTGILFNPASIAAMIRRLSDPVPYVLSDLRRGRGLWFSFDHHGSFSRPDPEEALSGINRALAAGAEAFSRADYAIFTFGTAWAYRSAAEGRIVANCHKCPVSEFIRSRLTVESIVDEYSALVEGPLAGKQVLLTVSPVRHVGDGLAGNAASKAVLRLAAETLVERYPARVFYFPSYEMLVDDLRDYRFYAADMVHPSEVAVEYVWQRFAEFAMEPATRALLPKLARLAAAMSHRIVCAGASGGEAFRVSSLRLIDELQKSLPAADFSAERAHFEAMASDADPDE